MTVIGYSQAMSLFGFESSSWVALVLISCSLSLTQYFLQLEWTPPAVANWTNYQRNWHICQVYNQMHCKFKPHFHKIRFMFLFTTVVLWVFGVWLIEINCFWWWFFSPVQKKSSHKKVSSSFSFFSDTVKFTHQPNVKIFVILNPFLLCLYAPSENKTGGWKQTYCWGFQQSKQSLGCMAVWNWILRRLISKLMDTQRTSWMWKSLKVRPFFHNFIKTQNTVKKNILI